MNRLMAIVSTAALSACAVPATQQPMASAADMEEMRRPLICESREQCDDWWRKAKFWVTSNSTTKVQFADDMVVQTYNPTRYTHGWAFDAKREPLEGGKDRIWLVPKCYFSCGHQATVSAEFKRYVRGEAK